MDPTFWQDRWRKGEIGFHQKEVNDLLVKHWAALGLAKGTSVLVPLAGKSLDMAWLASIGHRVVGSELSELALDAFLSGQRLDPAHSYDSGLVVKRAGPYELWLGDHFALPAHAARAVSAAYDRAALIAMPRTLQDAYMAKLAALIAPGTLVLLIAMEYDPSQMGGPPFPIPEAQVRKLCDGRFDLAVLERREGPPKAENLRTRGLTWVAETVYLLRKK
jgi:thiopurine S-methyltransferase